MQSLDKYLKKIETKNKQKVSKKYPLVIRFDAKDISLRNINVFDKAYRVAITNTVRFILQRLLKDDTNSSNILVYIQGDEINIIINSSNLLNNFLDKFNRDVQKIISFLSAEVALFFNSVYEGKKIIFDVKVFNIPKAQIQNYFLFRQSQAYNYFIQKIAKDNIAFFDRVYTTQADLKMKLDLYDINLDKFTFYEQKGVFYFKGKFYNLKFIQHSKSSDISLNLFIKNNQEKQVLLDDLLK